MYLLKRIFTKKSGLLLFRISVTALLGYIAIAAMVTSQLPPYGAIQDFRLQLNERITGMSGADWADQLETDDSLFLLVRHAAREESIDVQGFDLYELEGRKSISDFVCLKEEGKAQAELLGWALKKLERELFVISSPSCRAKETALLAFGTIDLVDAAHLHSSALPKSRRDYFKTTQVRFFKDFQNNRGSLVVIVGHNGQVYENAKWVSYLDAGGMRDQGGISVASWDPLEEKLTIHYTYSRLSDFIMAVF